MANADNGLCGAGSAYCLCCLLSPVLLLSSIEICLSRCSIKANYGSTMVTAMVRTTAVNIISIRKRWQKDAVFFTKPEVATVISIKWSQKLNHYVAMTKSQPVDTKLQLNKLESTVMFVASIVNRMKTITLEFRQM